MSVVALTFAGLGVGIMVENDDPNSDVEPAFQSIGAGMIVTGLIVAIPFGLAASYGYVQTAKCRALAPVAWSSVPPRH